LAAVDARVDRSANIHEQIDSRNAQLSGKSVNEHLGHCGALRVVKERRSLTGLPIEVDARRGIETTCAQIHAAPPGLSTKLTEGEFPFWPATIVDVTVSTPKH
jgi:hypothetical protein